MLSSTDLRSILALMARVESIKPAEARAFIALEEKVAIQHNAMLNIEKQAAEREAAAHTPTE